MYRQRRPSSTARTEWRMRLAEDLPATTDLGVGVVARRDG
jgi:hypothetical protein